MSKNTNQMEQASRLASAQQPAVDDAGEAMGCLRIYPKNVLESLSHLRIDRARIKPIESQAPKEGGNADVEAAILVSVPPSSPSKHDDEEFVAVKKLRFDEDTDDARALASLAHEVSLLNDLSHENVVKIVGFVEDVGQRVAWMVFAWEKNGNLREFIRSANWELPERVSLIDDVAEGLSYLHGRHPPICHGDLKSLNILVSSENLAVITDFGSARAVDPVTEAASNGVSVAEPTGTPHQAPTGAQMEGVLTAEIAPSGEFITVTGPAWTVRWAAPELLKGDNPGLASDIWALGWICWEAVTGNFPFDEDHNVLAIARITKGDLPTIESDHQFKQIQALCSLMRECWKLDASERTTAARFRQVVLFMDKITPSPREESSSTATHSSGLLYALGRIQLENSMHTEAEEYFERALKVAESVGDVWGRARAWNGLGDVSTMRSEHSKAEESYNQARESYSQIGNRLGLAHSLNNLGHTYRWRDEYSKAEETYTQARDIYSQIGDRHGLAHSAKALGEVYRIRNEYSKAEESYIQARDIYSDIGDRFGFAQSAWSLGEVYRMRDEYITAEELYIQARETFNQIGNRHGFAHAVRGLGEVYRMRDEYSKAEESLTQACDIYSEVGDRLGLAQSFNSLGDVYRSQDEYPKAEELYIQARDIYSDMGDRLGVAQSSESLGGMYYTQNEYSKAEESYVQARDIYPQLGDRLGFARLVKNLGHIYRMQGNYSKAEEAYIQARDIYSEIGNRLALARSVKDLGEVYRMQDEYSKAEESYIQARDIYSEIGDQPGLAQSLEVIGHVQSARGDFATAEESYSEAQRIYRQIGDTSSSADISCLLGSLYFEQAQYSKAERLVREASAAYAGLGLHQRLEGCENFIQAILAHME